MARAIAIRCFCPPLNCVPLEPTGVSYFCRERVAGQWRGLWPRIAEIPPGTCLRQRLDEGVDVGEFGGRLDPLLVHFVLRQPVGNVLPNGEREQGRLLADQCHRFAQVAQIVATDVHAVNAEATTFGNLEKRIIAKWEGGMDGQAEAKPKAPPWMHSLIGS